MVVTRTGLHAALPLTLLISLMVAPATAGAQVPGPVDREWRVSPEPPQPPMPDRQDFQVTLGAGVGFGPEYPGSGDLDVLPLPVIDIEWRRGIFLSSRRGLGLVLFDDDRFRVTTQFTYDFGRDEDDGGLAEQLDEIDPSIEFGARAHLRLGRFAGGQWLLDGGIRQDISDGHGGFVIDGGLSYNVNVTENFFWSFTGSTAYVSDSYNDAYFGVSATEAARTTIGAFDAEGGFNSVSLGTTASLFLDRNWAISGIGTVSRLLGDASDSPVSEEDTQIFLGSVVTYSFGF